MLKNSKKAIMYEFLVRLVIAILFVSAAVMIGRSFFRLSDTSLDSYYELVNSIKEQDEPIIAKPLIIDENTALIGLNSGADFIKLIHSSRQNPFESYFYRPAQCEKGKACLCLCRDGWENAEMDGPHNVENEHVCEEIICNSFNSIDFIDSIDSEDFKVYYPSLSGWHPPGNPELKDIYTLRGGFIYYRGSSQRIKFPGTSSRTVSIYLEKKDSKVAACFRDPPCFPYYWVDPEKLEELKENPVCRVDSSCIVENSPCICNTFGSLQERRLPELCTENQYCYEGLSGCESDPDQSITC